MRTMIALLLVLAIPTFAAAQQQADPVDDVQPVVEMQESAVAPTDAAPAANASATDAMDAAGADVEVETRAVPVEDAAEMQELGSRSWWWVVGAVVVGGLILAVIL